MIAGKAKVAGTSMLDDRRAEMVGRPVFSQGVVELFGGVDVGWHQWVLHLYHARNEMMLRSAPVAGRIVPPVFGVCFPRALCHPGYVSGCCTQDSLGWALWWWCLGEGWTPGPNR